MAEILDNTIVISDDEGNEQEWKILFHYENEERGRTYYFIYREEDPDNLTVVASENGEELILPDEEELEEAEEVLEAYENDPKFAEIK